MKERESKNKILSKNTKSFFLGIFVGVIALLLILNFVSPAFLSKNKNLNQNSNIGELYQEGAIGPPDDPSEEYNCNDEQNKICENLCYMVCEPADNKIGFQCKINSCLEPRECDGKGECILENLCDEYDCPPCKKCKTTITTTGIIPMCDIVMTDGTACNIGDNICNPGECKSGTCKQYPLCDGVDCPIGQVCVDGICDNPLFIC